MRFDKAQLGGYRFAYFRRILPAAMVRNAECRQTKTGCGDARHIPGIRSGSLAAVLHQPGGWIDFVPEKLKTGTLQFFQKAVLFRGESVPCGITAEERSQPLGRWRRYLRRERSGILPSFGALQLRERGKTQRHSRCNTRGQPQPVAA